MKHNWLSVSGTSVPKLGLQLQGSKGKAVQRSLPSGSCSPSGMAATVLLGIPDPPSPSSSSSSSSSWGPFVLRNILQQGKFS